jgi:predicted PolB exonuclease-like 3'-5' exonuclease
LVIVGEGFTENRPQKVSFSLNDLCRALNFPGKPHDIDGGEVDRYVQEGRIGEVASYCETDVVSTYRVWLVHELFRGTLSRAEFEESEANLLGFLRTMIGSAATAARIASTSSCRKVIVHTTPFTQMIVIVCPA